MAAFFFAGAGLAGGELEATLDLDAIPGRGETRVWSPLLQACWDKLHQAQGGKIEKVEPPNRLIGQLQKFQWDEQKVMPGEGYAVYVGPANPEFARKTKAAIKEQFQTDIDIGEGRTIPGGKAAYGILLRDLKFEKKFYRSKKSGLNFRSRDGEKQEVEFFGCAGRYSSRFSDQVKVLHYENGGRSFALSIATKTEGERLVVYRPEKVCSFRGGIERVKEGLESPLAGEYGSVRDGRVHRNDVLKIPCLALEVDTDFSSQLSGTIHYLGNPVPWSMARVVQKTEFELSEEGAKVRVHAEADVAPFGPSPKPIPATPRKFICEEAFFVFLWKDGAAWPYFGAWIDGPECLTKFSAGRFK